MADIKSLAVSRSALLRFDPRFLKTKPGLNARDMTSPETVAHIEWLAQSIADEGVKQPLQVFKEGDDVFVSEGHCRLTATLLAISRGIPIESIPCIPEPGGTSEADRILSQNVYNTGRPLTMLEQGVNIKRAHQVYGTSIVDIAKKIGRSVDYVRDALNLQGAPEDVKQLVSSGKVSQTLAAATIKRDGPQKGVQKIRDAVVKAEEKGKAKATAKDLPPEPVEENWFQSERMEQLMHRLIQRARAGDEVLANWLREAGISID